MLRLLGYTLIGFLMVIGSAQACSYARVSPAIPITITAVPVVVFGLLALMLRRKKTRRAQTSARICMALTFLAFAFFAYVTWANTLGWVSPCADWDNGLISQPIQPIQPISPESAK